MAWPGNAIEDDAEVGRRAQHVAALVRCAAPSANRGSAKRSRNRSSDSTISSLASCDPVQRWVPKPNDRICALAPNCGPADSANRVTSKRSGSANTSGSRLAAPISTTTRSPSAGSADRSSSASARTPRLSACTGGDTRSPSAHADFSRSRRSASSRHWSGCCHSRLNRLDSARSVVSTPAASRNEQNDAQLVVGESHAFVLGAAQHAQQVVAGMLAPVMDQRRDVGEQLGPRLLTATLHLGIPAEVRRAGGDDRVVQGPEVRRLGDVHQPRRDVERHRRGVGDLDVDHLAARQPVGEAAADGTHVLALGALEQPGAAQVAGQHGATCGGARRPPCAGSCGRG